MYARVSLVLGLQPACVGGSLPHAGRFFVIRKHQFAQLLHHDDAVRAPLYRNVIKVMATKLQNDNSRMADLQGEIEEERARTRAAVNLAASLGNLTADEIENRLTNQEENIEDETIDVVPAE